MRRTEEQITEEIMRRSDEYRRSLKKRRRIAVIAICTPLAVLLLFGGTIIFRLDMLFGTKSFDSEPFFPSALPSESCSASPSPSPWRCESPTPSPEPENAATFVP